MTISRADVAAFRRFSRYYTSRIGLLTNKYLGQDRPLGEARLLFEIGSGASLRELRTRLGLDAGYLSRVVHALGEQGLARVSAHSDDSRMRMVELTDAGEAELAEQHRRADAVAEDVLRGLTDGQRAELVEAITTAERLLRLGSITVDVVDPASAAARRCLEAFAAEIRVRFPEGFAAADLVRPGEIDGRAGVLLVAHEADRPIGCVALRRLDAGVGEVRHLWVHGECRGLGLGRRLMTEVERRALDRGMTTVRLGTHEVLTEAITLYQAIGYTPIPPYGDTPHTHRWFEKHLSAQCDGVDAAGGQVVG